MLIIPIDIRSFYKTVFKDNQIVYEETKASDTTHFISCFNRKDPAIIFCKSTSKPKCDRNENKQKIHRI